MQGVEVGKAVEAADPHVDPAQAPKLTGDNARVLDLLRQGPIGPSDCPFTLRLAARIHDLKRLGYVITSRRGPGHTAVYTLEIP